jgi:hypothetical protein
MGLRNRKLAALENYNTKLDKKTVSKIALMIKPELYSYIKKANTAKEAWEALRETFAPSDTCGKRSLLKRLFTALFQDYSSMETYINDVVSIVQKFSDLEYDIDDKVVAYVLLNGLPASYEALVMALDNCGKKLTPALVKARLMAEDVRRVENKTDAATAFVAKEKGKNGRRQKDYNAYSQNNSSKARRYKCNDFGHKASNYKQSSEDKRDDKNNTPPKYQDQPSRNKEDECLFRKRVRYFP